MKTVKFLVQYFHFFGMCFGVFDFVYDKQTRTVESLKILRCYSNSLIAMFLLVVPYSQYKVIADTAFLDSKMSKIVFTIEYSAMTLMMAALYFTIIVRRCIIRKIADQMIEIFHGQLENMMTSRRRRVIRVLCFKIFGHEICTLLAIIKMCFETSFFTHDNRYHLIIILSINFLSFLVTNVFVSIFLLFSFQFDDLNQDFIESLQSANFQSFSNKIVEYKNFRSVLKSILKLFSTFCVANFLFVFLTTLGEVDNWNQCCLSNEVIISFSILFEGSFSHHRV